MKQARTTNLLVVGDFARKAGITEVMLKDLSPRTRLMRTVLKSEVLHLLSTMPVDLILAVSGPLLLATEDLVRTMNSLPLPIPILVVSQPRAQGDERPHRPGEVVEYMYAPVDITQLRARVQALLSARAQLTRIEGVSLPGFVQLIEMERRTCTLYVGSAERRGILYFIEGKLVDARSPEHTGEPAVLQIFSWPNAIFAFDHHVEPGVHTVTRCLTDLLLDAARLGDELERVQRTDHRPGPDTPWRAGPYDLEFSDELVELGDPSVPPSTPALPAALPPVSGEAEPGQPGPRTTGASANGPPAPPESTSTPPPTPPPTPEATLIHPERQRKTHREISETTMANISKTMEEAMKVDGAIGVALADYESGMCLGQAGGGARLNIELAAAGNCQVVKAKMAIMSELGIRGAIHDIMITLDDQVHLLRPLKKYENLFLYLAIDKAKGNLAMARHRVTKLETELVL